MSLVRKNSYDYPGILARTAGPDGLLSMMDPDDLVRGKKLQFTTFDMGHFLNAGRLIKPIMSRIRDKTLYVMHHADVNLPAFEKWKNDVGKTCTKYSAYEPPEYKGCWTLDRFPDGEKICKKDKKSGKLINTCTGNNRIGLKIRNTSYYFCAENATENDQNECYTNLGIQNNDAGTYKYAGDEGGDLWNLNYGNSEKFGQNLTILSDLEKALKTSVPKINQLLKPLNAQASILNQSMIDTIDMPHSYYVWRSNKNKKNDNDEIK